MKSLGLLFFAEDVHKILVVKREKRNYAINKSLRGVFSLAGGRLGKREGRRRRSLCTYTHSSGRQKAEKRSD